MRLFFLLALTLILSPLLSSGAGAQAAPNALTGTWSGSLQVGGSSIPLVFHFTSKADGTLSAAFDSPSQGAASIAFSTAALTGSTVHLEVSAVGASFNGTLGADQNMLAGHWIQNGHNLPLTLTKTGAAPTPDRPQTPKPPFPYVSRDISFPGGASGVTLAGTLTLPPGAGPFPAAVLIAGSGPNDRDETIAGHKVFLLLADTLTRRGIAVLRYDKRGIGKSTGSYALATSADFASDAHAAVSYLKTQGTIDPKRIGVLGHSEGGLIAPLVASQHPSEIAFVVLLAGPGMDGEKILLAQAALIAKADGASGSDVAQNAALQKRLFTIAENAPDAASAQVQAQAAILRTVAAMTSASRANVKDPAQFARARSQAIASPWFRFFLTYDPLPALQKTACPVLALAGSKDLQVPPAENLALIGQALKAGGNANVTVKELPGLNHLFQTCGTGSPSEYAKITETTAPIALTTVSDWIAAQTGAK